MGYRRPPPPPPGKEGVGVGGITYGNFFQESINESNYVHKNYKITNILLYSTLQQGILEIIFKRFTSDYLYKTNEIFWRR